MDVITSEIQKNLPTAITFVLVANVVIQKSKMAETEVQKVRRIGELELQA